MKYESAKKFILGKLEKELPKQLTYHGVHHTLDVLNITTELCLAEKISKKNTLLLKTAALFHDSGFVKTYVNHEEVGCDMVKKNLPQYNYSKKDIEKICGMIMATKIPQNPKNDLEKIICDADLDYLGRSDFYAIGATLFEEFKTYGVVQDEESWNRLQLGFIGNHQYLTETTKRRREPQKQKYLQKIKLLVASYENK
ncbi:MAG TPA: HD domain-containing protein [Phaeodactylibacter sp.]|nr:HD domain-containing protein [Phaeodactylibacter sp.]